MVRISWRISAGTLGPTGLTMANLPPPERAEAPPMLGNDGGRLDDRQSRRPVAPDSAQPRPQEPIRGGQLGLLDRTTQDTELVPKREVLHLEGGAGLDGCRGDGGQQAECFDNQTKELKDGRQDPCSHAVRDFR